MDTSFTLKDLLNAYHEKCRELDHVRKIKDLLVDQNEKLIESNYESERVGELETELELLRVEHQELGKNRNVHLNRKLKLYEERIELNLIIDDLKAECSELRLDLEKERSFERVRQEYRDTLKTPSVDPNQPKPSYTGSYHIRWDDYKTGG